MSLATDLQVVSRLAANELDPLLAVDNAALLEAVMWDVLPGLVDQWSLAASAVAADWYDAEREKADVAGQFQAIVEPLQDLGAEALVGWATEPLRQPEPDLAAVRYRVVGGVQKRVANSANYTITGSSKADPQSRGWMRTTRAGACAFCVMVAGRGAVYTEKTARFACHEHCFCGAKPIWGGAGIDRVDPYTQSEATKNLTPKQREDLNKQARKWIADNLT